MRYPKPPRCSTCNDNRHMAIDARQKDTIPCSACGTKTDAEYLDFIRAHERNHAALPEICEIDLTPEEFVLFRRFQAEHPTVSKKTLLAWLEARRYDPRSDPDAVEDVNSMMVSWHAAQRKRAAAVGRVWDGCV